MNVFNEFCTLQTDFKKNNIRMNFETFKQWLFRNKPLSKEVKKSLSNPLKAIRQKCIDCSGGNLDEVSSCDCTACALWCYRYGRNPFVEEDFEK